MKKRCAIAVTCLHLMLFLCIDVNALEAKPSQKMEQNFQAQVLITDSHDAIAKWVESSTGRQAAKSGRLHKLSLGKKYYFPVVVTGIEALPSRGFPYTADLEFVSPKGKVNLLKNCSKADFGDARTPDLVVLNPVIDVEFDSSDPLGRYTVRATVTNGTHSASSSASFRLVADSEASSNVKPSIVNATDSNEKNDAVESAPECVIQPVMNDQQLRACGAHMKSQ